MLATSMPNKIISISKLPTLASGFTLIEILLSVGMLTMFMTANFLYYKTVLDVSRQTTEYIQAGFLLEEGVEAVKLMRDKGWAANIATLTNGQQYYLAWTGSRWATSSTPVLIENIFTRSFVVDEVYRSVNDDIVSSGGFLDTGTKKVAVTTSWLTKSGTTSSQTIETYITNLFSN